MNSVAWITLRSGAKQRKAQILGHRILWLDILPLRLLRAASDWEIEPGFSVAFADNGFRTIRRLPTGRFRQHIPSCSTGQRDGLE